MNSVSCDSGDIIKQKRVCYVTLMEGGSEDKGGIRFDQIKIFYVSMDKTANAK